MPTMHYVAMPCNDCGGALELTTENGGINGGTFTERYECANCGATGTITGESSEPPARWDKYGRVFQGPA